MVPLVFLSQGRNDSFLISLYKAGYSFSVLFFELVIFPIEAQVLLVWLPALLKSIQFVQFLTVT